MSITLSLLVLALTRQGKSRFAALKIDGQQVYRRTVFLGAAVDVQRKDGEADRFCLSLEDLRSELQSRCSQEIDEKLILLGPGATARALEERLKYLSNPQVTSLEDRVIVDIVSHGEKGAKPNLLLSADKKVGISRIAISKVRDLFLRIPSRHKLLIIDGCNSGSAIHDASPFSGARTWQEAKLNSGSIIWTSTQDGQDAQSGVSGTEFHDSLVKALRLIHPGETVLVSQIADKMGRANSLVAVVGPPNLDVVLSGPNSVEPQSTSSSDRRIDLQSNDADAFLKNFNEKIGEVSQLSSPSQAEKIKEAFKFMAGLSPDKMDLNINKLELGEQALSVFTPAYDLQSRVEVLQSLAYIQTRVGAWKPDSKLLRKAVENSKEVLNLLESEKSTDQTIDFLRVVKARWTLAVPLAELGFKGDPSSTEEARNLYDQNSKELIREKYPREWAANQDKLGNQLFVLGEKGTKGAVEKAISAFRSALEVRTRESTPWEWAATQNNLGMALEYLGERGNKNALKESVEVLHLAIEVRTRESYPFDWAITATNLGVALNTSGKGGDPKVLEEACSLLKSVLNVRTKDISRSDWGLTQLNLGNALVNLSDVSPTQSPQEAIEAYNESLDILKRDNDPLHWGMNHLGLGNAYVALGERGNPDAFKQAAKEFDLCLKLWEGKSEPARLGLAQLGLGTAYFRLGELGDQKQFESALLAYANAQLYYTLEDWPLDWAIIQASVGSVLGRQAANGNPKLFDEAIKTFKSCLPVFKLEKYPKYYAFTNHNLGTTYILKGEKGNATDAYSEAIKGYRYSKNERAAKELESEIAKMNGAGL